MPCHVLGMVWCPVGCAFPLALFHGIARDYIYSDTFDMEFQIGMLSISIYGLSIDSFSNCREDPLNPFLPIHCERKAGEDIQVGLATQPSVPCEGSLYGDVASDSRSVQYGLNSAFESPC